MMEIQEDKMAERRKDRKTEGRKDREKKRQKRLKDSIACQLFLDHGEPSRIVVCLITNF